MKEKRKNKENALSQLVAKVSELTASNTLLAEDIKDLRQGRTTASGNTSNPLQPGEDTLDILRQAKAGKSHHSQVCGITNQAGVVTKPSKDRIYSLVFGIRC